MQVSDLVNAGFEFGGGVGLLLNCRRLYRDKRVRGVDWRVTAFFGAWGYWNLYYYSGLDQWWSFAAGILPCCANTLWVAMVIYYRATARRSAT